MVKYVNNGQMYELEPGDAYHACCCEIVITRRGVLVFDCLQCEAIFGRFSQFLKHLLQQHNYKKPHQEQETTPSVIVNTNSKHGQTGSVKSEVNLKESHKYMCSKCERSFKYGCHLRLHKCDHPITNNRSESRCAQTIEMINKLRAEGVTYKCQAINKQLVDSDLQSRLMKSKVETVVDETIVNTDQQQSIQGAVNDKAESLSQEAILSAHTVYPCTKCKRKFSNESTLERHYVVVHTIERRYKCSICGWAFKLKENMIAHKRRHFSELKRFSCTICTSKFHTRKEMTKHTMRRHTDERPFICDECGKRFVTKDYLVIHMKRHKNERPSKCPLCDKSFSNNNTLKRHGLVHSSEYPYVCSICESKFKCNKSLASHMKIHTNKREYVCNICDAAFNQKPALLMHKKGKHKIIPIASVKPLELQLETKIAESLVNPI